MSKWKYSIGTELIKKHQNKSNYKDNYTFTVLGHNEHIENYLVQYKKLNGKPSSMFITKYYIEEYYIINSKLSKLLFKK